MDAIDILGSILGHKSSRGGKGSDVLSDILKGGSSRAKPKPSAKPNSRDIQRDAKDLEDLLNVANERDSHRRSTPQQRSTPSPSQRPTAQSAPASSSGGTDLSSNDRALILVRAMVSAAKADGRIDQQEQQNILERLGDSSPESIQFLRDEFSKPVDVREFAWSVPLGLEQQVYTMSLIAIDLDSGKEAQYLVDLAQGLRLPAEVREQIHERLGAPSIY